MTMDPEVKFGIRGAGRTGARTIEQKYALIASVVYTAIGIIGFFVTGFSHMTETTNHALLGLFYLNPFHNVVHIAIGALWLLGALVLSAPATEGLNLSIGAVYVLAAVLGYFGYLSLLNIRPDTDPDNFLHLISGLLTLVFAGPLALLRRGQAAYA